MVCLARPGEAEESSAKLVKIASAAQQWTLPEPRHRFRVVAVRMMVRRGGEVVIRFGNSGMLLTAR